jgi:hypothetical protein
VEVAGAALGLAAVNLVFALGRFAMLRDEDEVDGLRLAPAAQSFGQIAGQRPIDTALQFVDVGQGGRQRIADRLIGRRPPQSSASGGDGGNARGRVAEDGQQDAGATLGTVVAELEMLLDAIDGVQLHILGGEDILTVAHGFLPV